jgi:two-component system, OmpR family, sensor kinase
MTIRKRLTLWYAALLTIIIILFGAITYEVMRVQMINSIDNTLNETAEQVVLNSRLYPVPTFGTPTRVEIELAPLDVFRASGVYVQAWEIVDGEPEFKGRSANLATVDRPLNPDVLGVAHSDHYGNVNIDGVDLRVLTKPVTLGGRLVGHVQVAGDLAMVNQATDVLLVVMLITCGVGILGSMVVSMWFSHKALQPLGQINAAASRIAGTNDLSTRLELHGPQDELTRLASVFNHMMGRIEHMFSVQQRFVADVSHELRTPLTAIRGNLELARRYGMDDESLEAMEAETERMSRLVNDLLMLARADYGGIEIELYPLDLDAVVMEAYQQSKILLQGRELEFKLEHFEPVRINGNADRIKQLLFNLVSNAVKFTPDGGCIEIGLEHIDNRAVLWVKDSGIGIDDKDLDRIFDRFYQTEPSRHHTGGGFGLGLSIARWIVDSHQGTIRVSSRPDQGATFTVTLPVHESERRLHHSHNQPTRPRLPLIRRYQPARSQDHDSRSHMMSDNDGSRRPDTGKLHRGR